MNNNTHGGIPNSWKMEDRKRKEVEHSDQRRSIVRAYEYYTDANPNGLESEYVVGENEYDRHFSNMKFYSVARASFAYRDACLYNGIEGLRVLDYCCGNGEIGVQMALKGAQLVYGIDLSPVAIDNARELAAHEGVADKCIFEVMDAEDTRFPDASFDIIHEYGALHHLDLKSAYSELSRILKPDGRLVCTEAMRHNPIIHLYRRLTPHLRTQWEFEHILGVPEILMGKTHFSSVNMKFFHLASIGAVPFRKRSWFPKLLGALETVDRFVLQLPYIQRWAWVSVVVFSGPRKS